MERPAEVVDFTPDPAPYPFESPSAWTSHRAEAIAEFAHYVEVVPTPESREGIAVFPGEILRAHPWLAELETRVAATLADKPVVLMFGRKDPALASDAIIDHWKQQFPDATYIDLPNAGHYIQEDAPDEINGAIRAAFG